MTRKKWSFLFTVCLVTALIGCGQKNSQVDKNNSEELNKLGQIQVISGKKAQGQEIHLLRLQDLIKTELMV